MKRKFIAISMASVLACSLMAGCGGVEYAPEEDANISYLYVDTSDGGFGSEYLSAAAKAFEKEYAEKSYAENKKGVKIEVSTSAVNNANTLRLALNPLRRTCTLQRVYIILI